MCIRRLRSAAVSLRVTLASSAICGFSSGVVRGKAWAGAVKSSDLAGEMTISMAGEIEGSTLGR